MSKRLPEINVQIIHMKGPLKGEIQSFVRTPIAIGRHPSCQVCFPSDLAVVSRKHADIVREGNRFKIVDHSSNGTLVNGKQIKESFLQDGDVITLSSKGPKFSFMAETTGGTIGKEEIEQNQTTATRSGSAAADPSSPVRLKSSGTQPQPRAPVKAPVTIQFGPSLLTFDTLPITLGRGEGCDVPIEHPGLTGPHIRILYVGGEYLVEDASGSSLARKNNLPLSACEPLCPEDIIALSPEGPLLKYLGQGRFAEHHNPAGHTSPGQDNEATDTSSTPEEKQSPKQGVLDSVMKRLRRS